MQAAQMKTTAEITAFTGHTENKRGRVKGIKRGKWRKKKRKE
jgi:hypothetical protein